MANEALNAAARRAERAVPPQSAARRVLAGRTLPGRTLAGLARAVGDLLYPPACPACAADTAGRGLCGACFAETRFLDGPACATCGQPEPALPHHDPAYRCPTCLAEPPPLDSLTAVATYSGAARSLVLALKHGDRLDHVPLLAGWLHRRAADRLSAADAIIPVPLHWRRCLARRFNQSAEIARAAARLAGNAQAFDPAILTRHRATPSQQGRDRAERRANVAGAFSARPGSLIDRRVLLIDDVATSGATLAEAARICRHAGAAEVHAAVIALALRPRAPYLAETDGDTPPATPPATEPEGPHGH
ncbi:MAG: ComF family protein [Pseudomonadota bacterium]